MSTVRSMAIEDAQLGGLFISVESFSAIFKPCGDGKANKKAGV